MSSPLQSARSSHRHVLSGLMMGTALVFSAKLALGQQVPPLPQIASGSLEARGIEEYRQLMARARAANQLALPTHPQVVRMNYVLGRLTRAFPMTAWGARAKGWPWEIALIGSSQVGAFAMPGGKIVVYWGMLGKLQLTDAELAMVIGQQIGSSLLAHPPGSAAVDASGAMSNPDAGQEADRMEADQIGLELAARAGYDPQAAVSLWTKMMPDGGSPAASRLDHLKTALPHATALYEHASRPDCTFGPPGTTSQPCAALRALPASAVEGSSSPAAAPDVAASR